jgi:heptosyltransferase-2
MSETPRRVLVKEVNWLGDLVISFPALRAIHRAYPEAHLAVLVKHELAGFFDGCTWVDEVISYHVGRGLRGLADRRAVVRRIGEGRFDLAILFPKSFEAALWVTLARVPRRVGFATDARGLLLTHKTEFPAALRQRHQAYDYLHLLSATLGIAGDIEGGALDVHPQHRQAMQEWLQAQRLRPDRRLVALAVAAAYGPAKEWPAERFAALIDLLFERGGTECVLLGSPGERAKCERTAAASRRGAVVAAGDLGIGEAVALLSLCDGFAGNDSGAMHVAGALGIPTVGLYGSTNPARTAPLGARARVIYRPIECSPCLQRTCRFGHYRCLTQIEPAEVAEALQAAGALG